MSAPAYRVHRGVQLSDEIYDGAYASLGGGSMTKHPKGFAPAPWITLAIGGVKLFPEYLLQLTKVEEETLNAFNAFFAETKRFPTTTEVFERCKTSNKTSVSERLMRLVEMGYLGAYRKGNKWIWCDRTEAERLQTIIERNSK